GTNLDAGFFQIADGFKTVVVGVCGAGCWKKPARAFEVVAVTFESGFLQTVGDLLAFDDAERGVRSRLAAGFQFADAVADFVEDRPFVQPFPRSNEADGGDALFVRFIGGFLNRFGVYKAVFGRAGLIMRRLRTEAAILRARAGLGVDDGAEVDFVALEMFADAIGPGKQIKNVRGSFETEEPQRFFAGDEAAAQN